MMIFSFLTVIILAAADQGLKKIASENLTPGNPLNLLSVGDTEILTFSLHKNTGAAFSSLEGKTTFLIVVTAIMMAALAAGLIIYKPKQKLPVICISMVLGGGLGNLIDRALLGYVVDYIILFPFNFIFNFADICVVIGAIILGVFFFFADEKRLETAEEKNE